jgi:hypothetical protein
MTGTVLKAAEIRLCRNSRLVGAGIRPGNLTILKMFCSIYVSKRGNTCRHLNYSEIRVDIENCDLSVTTSAVDIKGKGSRLEGYRTRKCDKLNDIRR